LATEQAEKFGDLLLADVPKGTAVILEATKQAVQRGSRLYLLDNLERIQEGLSGDFDSSSHRKLRRVLEDQIKRLCNGLSISEITVRDFFSRDPEHEQSYAAKNGLIQAIEQIGKIDRPMADKLFLDAIQMVDYAMENSRYLQYAHDNSDSLKITEGAKPAFLAFLTRLVPLCARTVQALDAIVKVVRYMGASDREIRRTIMDAPPTSAGIALLIRREFYDIKNVDYYMNAINGSNSDLFKEALSWLAHWVPVEWVTKDVQSYLKRLSEDAELDARLRVGKGWSKEQILSNLNYLDKRQPKLDIHFQAMGVERAANYLMIIHGWDTHIVRYRLGSMFSRLEWETLCNITTKSYIRTRGFRD
jgi:hypothetical protein